MQNLECPLMAVGRLISMCYNDPNWTFKDGSQHSIDLPNE